MKLKVNYHWMCNGCSDVHVDTFNSLIEFAGYMMKKIKRDNPVLKRTTMNLYDESVVHSVYKNSKEINE